MISITKIIRLIDTVIALIFKMHAVALKSIKWNPIDLSTREVIASNTMKAGVYARRK
jgi:hypothetical protein